MSISGFGKRNQRGAAILEFVLVGAMLLFLLFGIMEIGFMFSNSLTVSSAAQQGARSAALQGKPKAVEAAVYNAASTLREPRDFSFNSGNITAESAPEGTSDWQAWTPGTAPPGGSHDQIRITVKYEYVYITGDLLGGLSNLMSGKTNKATDRRDLVGVAVMRYGG